MTSKTVYVKGYHAEPCPGYAHANPFIDNCGVCMPLWAQVIVADDTAKVAPLTIRRRWGKLERLAENAAADVRREADSVSSGAVDPDESSERLSRVWDRILSLPRHVRHAVIAEIAGTHD